MEDLDAEVTQGPPLKKLGTSDSISARDKDRSRTWWELAQVLIMASFFAFALTVLADTLAQSYPAIAFTTHILASAVLFSAVPLTHFSGRLTYSNFRYFMPGKGGARFVTFQVLGWIFYAIALIMSFSTLGKFINGIAASSFGFLTLWGSLALVSQIFIFSSLFSFENKNEDKQKVEEDEKKSTKKVGSLQRKPSLAIFSDTVNADKKGLWSLFSLLAFPGGFSSEMSAETTNLLKDDLGEPEDIKEEAELDEDFVIQSEEDSNESQKEAMRENLPMFIAVNVFLALVGFLLLLMCQMYYDTNPYFVICSGVSAVMFFTVSIFNTYGLGGHQMHGTKSDWKFFQPGKGGLAFCVTQTVSWVVFSASVLLQISALLFTYAFGFQMFIGVIALSGLLCIVAELVMIFSLHVYGDVKDLPLDGPRYKLKEAVDYLHGMILLTVFINVQYLPLMAMWIPIYVLVPHEDMLYCWSGAALSVCMFVFSFSLISVHRVKAIRDKKEFEWHWLHFIWMNVITDIPVMAMIHFYINSWQGKLLLHMFMVCHHVYLGYTFSSNPAETGSRAAKDLSPAMFDIMAKYFNGKIIRTVELDSDEQYLMGFHPHAVIPISVLWMYRSSEWVKLFPGITVNPCSASIVHSVPGMRDVMQYFGAREVTKTAIKTTWKQKQTVLLVPGGQVEMVLSKTHDKKMVVYTRHSGFVRLAIQNGIPLVPVVSIGENTIIDNIYLPNLQIWFIKRFGAPAPHFPYGYFFLPIPRAVPITVVVGTPMKFAQNDEPSTEEVKTALKQYYEQVVELYEKHKEEAGYGDWQIELKE